MTAKKGSSKPNHQYGHFQEMITGKTASVLHRPTPRNSQFKVKQQMNQIHEKLETTNKTVHSQGTSHTHPELLGNTTYLSNDNEELEEEGSHSRSKEQQIDAKYTKPIIALD